MIQLLRVKTENVKIKAIKTLNKKREELRHNDKSSEIYDKPDIVETLKSRKNRWAGHVVNTGEERTIFTVTLLKKKPVGRPKRGCVRNIDSVMRALGFEIMKIEEAVIGGGRGIILGSCGQCDRTESYLKINKT